MKYSWNAYNVRDIAGFVVRSKKLSGCGCVVAVDVHQNCGFAVSRD
jgi:hypothetical protein